MPQPREGGAAARGAGEHALPVSQAVEPEALVSATGGVLADAWKRFFEGFLFGRETTGGK